MSRARGVPARRARRRKVLRRAKGFVGGRHRLYKTARDSVRRSLAFAFVGRKARKRQFRRLWVIRLNAACRQEGLSYSRFMAGLKKARVILDRKTLADLCVRDREVFKKLVDIARQQLTATA